jgi:hypothetical protein
MTSPTAASDRMKSYFSFIVALAYPVGAGLLL